MPDRQVVGRFQSAQPKPRWHDGQPITADDVIFSFKTLKAKGTPFFRAYYANVVKVEQIGDRKVKFTFNHERQPRVAADHGTAGCASEALLGKPRLRIAADGPATRQRSLQGQFLRDGPLRHLEACSRLLGRKSADQCGTIQLGHRFDTTITAIDTVALEAFKAGQYDFRAGEQRQELGHGVRHTRGQGRPHQEARTDPTTVPTGMQAFVFNTRRDIFKDRARARGARLCVRLRVDQQDDLLWPVHADEELFRQLRARFKRAAEPAKNCRSSKSTAAGFPMRSSRPNISRRPPTVAATTASTCARRSTS